MPIIRVEMVNGRSDEQKKALAKQLTSAFVETCGGNAEAIHVVITEIDKSDWAVGAEMLSDRFPDS